MYSSPASSIARRPSRSSETMRRPSRRSSPAASVPRQIFASSAPDQRPFVSVWWMLFGADKDDRAVPVALTYSFDSSVAGHATADDQVAGRFHVVTSPVVSRKMGSSRSAHTDHALVHVVRWSPVVLGA